jgi:hypothetical protein
MTLIPGTIALVSDIQAPTVKIGVIAALAITCGILVSGTRRHERIS